MKQNYIAPEVSVLDTQLRMSVLTGSVTSVKMTINTVTVHDYTDGFESDGGFKDISFD